MKKLINYTALLVCIFALLMIGCGKQEAGETLGAQAPQELTLGVKEATLSASTWSSPNGATIHLRAVPYGYAEGCGADFVVMLGEEEIAKEPCTWDGSAFTADVELNAADGLGYYIQLTAPDRVPALFPVNTADYLTDESLIDLAASLESYCHVMAEGTEFADGKLTLTSGVVQVQAPRITNDGEAITVTEAVLSLSFNGQEVDSQSVELTPAASRGAYELSLSGISFTVPALENDQQLHLTMTVTLSNGHVLSAAGGTFFYNDGELLTAVG